jgi:hypothetical protein
MLKPRDLPRLSARKFPSRIHLDSKGKRGEDQKYPQKLLPRIDWKTGDIEKQPAAGSELKKDGNDKRGGSYPALPE